MVSSKVEILTASSVLELLTLRSAYLLGYAWLLGMCEYSTRPLYDQDLISCPNTIAIWVTFFGGFIALKALRKL